MLVASHSSFHFFCRIQSLALSSNILSDGQKFNLHALVISVMVLIPSVLRIKALTEYANKIVEARKQEAPHLLPELLMHYSSDCEGANKLPHLMLDQVHRNSYYEKCDN